MRATRSPRAGSSLRSPLISLRVALDGPLISLRISLDSPLISLRISLDSPLISRQMARSPNQLIAASVTPTPMTERMVPSIWLV